jgi:uncharacterized protein YggU (UPF0235/DUF167 family)
MTGRSDSAISADDLDLVEVEGGVRLRLRVRAGARQNALLGTHAGALKLSVTAAPEKGKANKALLALLADRLDLSASSIELVSGASAQDKTVVVPLGPAALRRRLSGL